jgi:L-lysine 2,3-aminomutase
MVPWLTNETLLSSLGERQLLTDEILRELRILSHVFPLKNTAYVINTLIDWHACPDDPVYRLTFPRKEMLKSGAYEILDRLSEKTAHETKTAALQIRMQTEWQHILKTATYTNNKKTAVASGIWHQVPNTILLFPAPLQECFAHCSYCGRWMMHGHSANPFRYSDPALPSGYISGHPEISDALFTGGDAIIAPAGVIKEFIEPILHIDSIRTVRLATKALSYWPDRFLTDDDSDEVLRLFDRIRAHGKQCAVMAHVTHPRELSTETVRKAIDRIKSTGAVIRCQCPLVKNINDSADVLKQLWKREIDLGLIPYYLFLDDSSGLNDCFRIPIARAVHLFKASQTTMSGLAKTVRGPVFNNIYGKILVDVVVGIEGKKYFLLTYLQTDDRQRAGKTFPAHYDARAYDFDQLRLIGNY